MEQQSKAKLQEEFLLLKEQYENSLEAIDREKPIDAIEAQKRLERLEQQFVGGEQVNKAY